MNQSPILPKLTFAGSDETLEAGLRTQLEDFPWLEGRIPDAGMLDRKVRAANIFLVEWPYWNSFVATLAGQPDKFLVIANSVVVSRGEIPDSDKLSLFLAGASFVADAHTVPADLRTRLESLLSVKSKLVARQIVNDRLRSRIVRQQEQLNHQNDFLHMAVHDLRSPLAAMICYAELLMEGVLGNLEVTQLEPIRTIHRNCQFLVDMVTDLLDSAKIGAGKLQLKLEKVNILKEVQLIVQSLKGLGLTRGIHIELKAEQVPDIYLDIQKISRVLANLLGNAIKFTKTNGKIVINVQKRDNNLICSIQDMGPGISQADLSAIFQKFDTGSGSNISGKGHGLGLTISKSFVELHGGRLYVESTRHKGSVFIVNLPIEKRLQRAEQKRRHRILVLDLGGDMDSLSTLSESIGFSAFHIEYLASHWSSWKEVGKRNFDFVLVNEAREVPDTLKDYYLLALSEMSAESPSALLVNGTLSAEDRDLRRYLGFHIIEKPCTSEELFDKLQFVIGIDRRQR